MGLRFPYSIPSSISYRNRQEPVVSPSRTILRGTGVRTSNLYESVGDSSVSDPPTVSKRSSFLGPPPTEGVRPSWFSVVFTDPTGLLIVVHEPGVQEDEEGRPLERRRRGVLCVYGKDRKGPRVWGSLDPGRLCLGGEGSWDQGRVRTGSRRPRRHFPGTAIVTRRAGEGRGVKRGICLYVLKEKDRETFGRVPPVLTHPVTGPWACPPSRSTSDGERHGRDRSRSGRLGP